MKAILQRVSEAYVKVSNKTVGEIKEGLLILLGIGKDDSEEDIEYLISKITNMRIFNDENGKMNLNIHSIKGNCLVISQFTLFASTKKGNRPSFINASPPEIAESLYLQFCESLSNKLDKKVEKGIFGANMNVGLINDGPVTISLDSKRKE